MNAFIAWALAAAALFVGWQSHGLNGLALAGTLIVFWLLLHFNRVMRVMRNASHRPIGHIGSAVMLGTKLRPGMTMLQVMALTRSLGEKQTEAPEVWAWRDGYGNSLALTFVGGKLSAWVLHRAPEAAPDTGNDSPHEAANDATTTEPGEATAEAPASGAAKAP